MAITTKGTKLTITGYIPDENGENTAITPIEVLIKSFPDLGAAPTAIEVTTLADDVQKFIPGIKGMAAMEFTANYDAVVWGKLDTCKEHELTYTLNFEDGNKYGFTGKHSTVIVGGGLNAVVDMKVVVVPSSGITKAGDTPATEA